MACCTAVRIAFFILFALPELCSCPGVISRPKKTRPRGFFFHWTCPLTSQRRFLPLKCQPYGQYSVPSSCLSCVGRCSTRSLNLARSFSADTAFEVFVRCKPVDGTKDQRTLSPCCSKPLDTFLT